MINMQRTINSLPDLMRTEDKGFIENTLYPLTRRNYIRPNIEIGQVRYGRTLKNWLLACCNLGFIGPELDGLRD